MNYRSFGQCCSLLGAAVIFAACTDGESVTGPGLSMPIPAPSTQEMLVCSAVIAAETIFCAPQETSEDATVQRSHLRKVIIGGQGEYVKLTSSNVEVTDDIFAFDVTLENLIGQSLGTYNRSTVTHPDGVRVFFATGPISAEGGEVQVANPDGYGTFTETAQPYFQYEGSLEPGETSLPKRWQLRFDENVSTFNFTLYVSAEVKWRGGYVDGFPELVILDPSESRTGGAHRPDNDWKADPRRACHLVLC